MRQASVVGQLLGGGGGMPDPAIRRISRVEAGGWPSGGGRREDPDRSGATAGSRRDGGAWQLA